MGVGGWGGGNWRQRLKRQTETEDWDTHRETEETDRDWRLRHTQRDWRDRDWRLSRGGGGGRLKRQRLSEDWDRHRETDETDRGWRLRQTQRNRKGLVNTESRLRLRPCPWTTDIRVNWITTQTLGPNRKPKNPLLRNCDYQYHVQRPTNQPPKLRRARRSRQAPNDAKVTNSTHYQRDSPLADPSQWLETPKHVKA